VGASSSATLARLADREVPTISSDDRQGIRPPRAVSPLTVAIPSADEGRGQKWSARASAATGNVTCARGRRGGRATSIGSPPRRRTPEATGGREWRSRTRRTHKEPLDEIQIAARQDAAERTLRALRASGRLCARDQGREPKPSRGGDASAECISRASDYRRRVPETPQAERTHHAAPIYSLGISTPGLARLRPPTEGRRRELGGYWRFNVLRTGGGDVEATVVGIGHSDVRSVRIGWWTLCENSQTVHRPLPPSLPLANISPA
jgi:hypothetical protein